MAFNIVELAADENDDCGFDQPCKFGHHIKDHAIYCHNDDWTDSPRKCRRTWYTGGKTKDEDCPGFEANPEFKGELNPTPLVEPLCSKCMGRKRIKADRGKTETCPLCCGDGQEPQAMKLNRFEKDVLENGTMFAGLRRCNGERFMQLCSTQEQSDAVLRLCKLGLVTLRVMAATDGVTGFLLENTSKAAAVLHATYKRKKNR